MTGEKKKSLKCSGAQNNNHLLVGQNVAGLSRDGLRLPHMVLPGIIFMTRVSTGMAESLTMKWRLIQACSRGSSILRGWEQKLKVPWGLELSHPHFHCILWIKD